MLCLFLHIIYYMCIYIYPEPLTLGIVGRKSAQKAAKGSKRAIWIKRSEMVWTVQKHKETQETYL